MADYHAGNRSAGRGARSVGRKEARAQAARAHIDDMAHRYAREIEASAAGVRRIDGTLAFEVANPCVPTVAVTDEDGVAAVVSRGRGRAQFCDLALLDFASFTHPGGGYERGAWAQEEALCSESFLYNVLAQQKDWYAENRRRHINCGLYRNRALIVPRVRFARENVHAYADVIVAAAPNARRAQEEYHVDDATLERAMRERIRLVLALVDELGHERLVAGAFGCGAFGWDAAKVAELFLDELARGEHGVREVIFAVPATRYDENHERFAHALAHFPEKNNVPFEDVQAEREARAAAEQAAAEEGEDDWRKYL